ncbi:MAG: CocE/NonD family hydrolase [Actinomycetota bacterium]
MARREQVRIGMPDGIELSATLFLPDTEVGPWPALMEALPYRKDDATSSSRDYYASLADAGYVVCRLDVRGTGSSGGIATDEYTAAERRDLVTTIEWLASRPWSTGGVGMFGTSYGGFNSLQVALERPPALKAIVPIFASDDRYGDDVHYYGGALKQLDVVDYPTYMVAMNALPPVPALWGEDWREEWQRRLERTEPWFLTWLAHQHRDAYWRDGSVREDVERIQAATMIVGGWADGYTNIALRSFPRMKAPTRLLLGPWAHGAPETCRPGPNIDFTTELLRWFDRWLKDIDNGIDREPPIVVYQQRSTAPDPLRGEVRGEWRFEPTLPPERLRPTAYALTDAEASAPQDTLIGRGDVGATAWISCAGALPWGQSADQRPDEAKSLTYTWEPLVQDLEIFGHPRLRIRVTCDRPTGFVSAKITDVFPDGASSLVVRGMANLAQRPTNAGVAPVMPGETVELDLELEAIAWTFEAGHRIRLDLAGADWPNAWPPPYAATLGFDRATAALELPVLAGPPPVREIPGLRAVVGKQHGTDSTEDGWWRWVVERDATTGMQVARTGYGGTSEAGADSFAYRDRYEGVVGVSPEDPGIAFAYGEGEFEIGYPEGTVRTTSHVRLDSDAETYRVTIELRAFDDGREIFRKGWERTIARELQ